MNDWFDAESHYEKARQYYEDGRWAEAESELREAISMDPSQPEWHFNLGLTLEAAGRHEEAARAFLDCHGLESDDAQVMVCLGVNLARAGKDREAIEWLERAGRADPQNVDSLVHRIRCYAGLGDHEQAEVMFYMAQQVQPRDARAYLNLADSLLARGLHEKAVWCLREAAGLDPKMPGIHARLAEGYAATGRLERARQLYLRELRNDPGDIHTLLDLGCLLMEMNRPQEAGEKLRRVLEQEPDNPDAHFHLGELAQRQGRSAEALGEFGVALRLDPEFPGARRRIAALLLARADAQDLASARELLEAEAERFRAAPASLQARDLADLGRTLLDAEMYGAAREALEALVAREPDGPEGHHLLSVALFNLGRRAEGVEVCRKVLKLDPKFVPAMHNVAVAYVLDHQWAKARYWVRQALLVDPDDAKLRRLRFKLRLHAVAEVSGALLAGVRGLFSRRRV
jgi:tetratricopeptide (TPR) repeat protein